MESIGLSLIYLLKGTLPWYDIECETNEERILEVKQSMNSTSLINLCRDCPYSLRLYMEYCRNKMRFEDEPDYNYLLALLYQCIERE